MIPIQVPPGVDHEIGVAFTDHARIVGNSDVELFGGASQLTDQPLIGSDQISQLAQQNCYIPNAMSGQQAISSDLGLHG
jgi:hypothetical protein